MSAPGDERGGRGLRCRFDEAAGRGGAGRLRLNGTKFWITNGAYADTLVVYAKTAPDAGARASPRF
jgi:alkylation response protein AidB-like acyl-CoA dehydrogenase